MRKEEYVDILTNGFSEHNAEIIAEIFKESERYMGGDAFAGAKLKKLEEREEKLITLFKEKGYEEQAEKLEETITFKQSIYHLADTVEEWI